MNADYDNVLRALGWIDKVTDYFRRYKPETKSMTINYQNRDAEIELLLHISDNIKRKIRKVEIPAYQNFVISEMRDESFNRIGALWRFEDGKWKLNPSNLPSSERYLLTLKGKLSEDALTKIVFVQPAANKDRTGGTDKYWLTSMIRNVEILEKLWDTLNINDVNAGVRIGIERSLSSAIPNDLRKRIEVTQRWMRAGHGTDWHGEIFRTWKKMRMTTRVSKVSANEIIEIIYKLSTGDFMSSFIAIDRPYTIGKIKREETFKGTFPERMHVEACTYLNLKQPVARGYLTFKKNDYTKTVKKEFDGIITQV